MKPLTKWLIYIILILVYIIIVTLIHPSIYFDKKMHEAQDTYNKSYYAKFLKTQSIQK